MIISVTEEDNILYVLQYSTCTHNNEEDNNENTMQELEHLIKNRRRNSLLGTGHDADLTQLQTEVHANARSRAQQIQEHCDEPAYREKVLRFIFLHFANWSPKENASYISRNSFRQACREMQLRNSKFVHGDIEVVFVDALLSSMQNKQNVRKKQRPLLNFRQFLMAMQLVAIKLYGKPEHKHLDPRFVVLVGKQGTSSAFVEPFHHLYHKRLLPASIRFGMLDDDDENQKTLRHGGLATSPRDRAKAAVESRQDSTPSNNQQSSSSTGNLNKNAKESPSDPKIQNAMKTIQIDHKALRGLFKTYAVSDLSNSTGALSDHGLSFEEFARFARDCEIVPRFCSLS